jgi:hypothetical protein
MEGGCKPYQTLLFLTVYENTRFPIGIDRIMAVVDKNILC